MKILPTYSHPRIFKDNNTELTVGIFYSGWLFIHSPREDTINEYTPLKIPEEIVSKHINRMQLKQVKYEETIINGELRRAYGYYSRNGYNVNRLGS